MKASKLVSVLLLAGGAACGQKSCSAGAEEPRRGPFEVQFLAGGIKKEVASGGTAVRIPLDDCTSEKGKRLVELVENLELDLYQCPCGKDIPDPWRFDACAACGKKWEPVRKKSPIRAYLDDGSLLVDYHGDFARLWVLHLSSIENCVRDAGMKIKRKGFLAGPFALAIGHGDAAKMLEAFRKLPGVETAETSAGVLYVNQNRSRKKVDYAAMEKFLADRGAEIKDLSWVPHRCYGMTGFVEK